MKNRRNFDWSKHQHRIEIFKNGEKEIRIDHFQVGNSRMNYIQFINTDEILSITGDFGNWIFCRPFVPNPKGYVSDGYWIEKLQISSEQKLDEYDLDECQKEINELIETGLHDYGYEGEELKKAKEWFTELSGECDDKINYLCKAYRDYDQPSFIDFEMIPDTKVIPVWLLIIFDAFDEICFRLKQSNE